MVGAGEAFFAAYSLHLGFSELQASVLVTVPIVIGGVVQLIAPFGINVVKSYKRWTITGVFLQAMLFWAFILFDKFTAHNFEVLFILVTIYWSLALGITPGWNTWISALLKTGEIRGFFSTRNVMMSLGTLFGLLLSGVILHFVDTEKIGFEKFYLIFGSCFLFRLVCFFALINHQSVPFKNVGGINKGKDFFFIDNIKGFPFRFIFFSCVIKIGVFFSASFFSPYMLKQLKFSYLDYALVLVSAFVGRTLLGGFLRKFIHRFDINRVQLFASIGISFIPILWTFSTSYQYIIFLEVLTGLMWGAFEISFYVTCFEEIPTEKQAQMMTWYNLLHTLCIGVGCFFGLMTFAYLGNHYDSYITIFMFSGLLRGLSLLAFPRRKIVNGEIVVSSLVRTLGVKPSLGIFSKPLWQLFKKIKKK
jgi:MFS family permease